MAHGTSIEDSTPTVTDTMTTTSRENTNSAPTSHQYSTSDSSDRAIKPPSSPCPPTAMGSTPTYKTVDQIQKLINESPDLRSSLFSLLQATIAAAEAEQPELIRDKDAMIEDLKKQLLQALEFGNVKTAEVERLEALVKLATDTGLEQIEHLEELNAQVKRLEQVEQNLRRGNMALQKAMEPLKDESAVLRRKVRDQDAEIRELVDRYDEQSQSLKIYNQRARNAETMTMRLEVDLDKLERENQHLILKGEEMSGKLLSVAGEWHEPMAATQRKRKGTVEETGEGDILRKFKRRF
jgi:chromosome segregation ATPase